MRSIYPHGAVDTQRRWTRGQRGRRKWAQGDQAVAWRGCYPSVVEPQGGGAGAGAGADLEHIKSTKAEGRRTHGAGSAHAGGRGANATAAGGGFGRSTMDDEMAGARPGGDREAQGCAC